MTYIYFGVKCQVILTHNPEVWCSYIKESSRYKVKSLDPEIQVHPGASTLEWKQALLGTYGPNMNALWWVAVEIWTSEKLAYKTLSQCDGNADAKDQGDSNSSPCTSYNRAKNYLLYFDYIESYIHILENAEVSVLWSYLVEETGAPVRETQPLMSNCYPATCRCRESNLGHRPGVTGRNFSPVSFFPGEKPGQPILSPGKKLTSQFFPHPVSFFPPYIFYNM